ncbi:MAG: Nramp family divalent metal transporter [Bryobacteraceae bacterium]|nr:Nramp family divalent metal transporter [Bryobacteraceae bacterium]MDW8377907.1 Nramp family divalent metal transporter [Bryobacterales bacterium]
MNSGAGPAATSPLGIKDPYAYNPEEIENPPRSLGGMLRRIGPGMILSASIVGSGELIATTTLGAEVGFVALWVILISCLIKPSVQAELGRYTIATGKTGLDGFDQVPGPRWKVNWIVWMWAFMVLMTMFQIGAMFGGVAQVLNQLMPSVSVELWVPLLAALTLALLLTGGYERVEKLATLKVALFTMLTFLCALLLLAMPQFFEWKKLLEGLQFKLPPQGMASAVAVFGITGVGAAELFMYPYWCVEKGYARFTGPCDGSPEWRARALGWIAVMNLDIVASMVIYTVATVAFYVLGAGILHSQGLVPAAKDMIPVLSRMYTQTLGNWSLWLFYAGAIATLYGTIFAATAANSRVYADLARMLGCFRADDYASRIRWRNYFVWGLILVPVALFYGSQSPVFMVKLGGVAQAFMLPVIAVGALYLRFRRLPPEVAPGKTVTSGLVAASAVIILVMSYYAMLSLR